MNVVYAAHKFHRTSGSVQVQAEEEISIELIEERERAIRQLEVKTVQVLTIYHLYLSLCTSFHSYCNVNIPWLEESFPLSNIDKMWYSMLQMAVSYYQDLWLRLYSSCCIFL